MADNIGEMLVERPSQVDIEHLGSAADTEKGK
jgi:hypothetical protein